MSDYDGIVIVDLETTGLDMKRPRAAIVQFAMIATDIKGQPVGRYETVLCVPDWRSVCEPGALALHESSGLAAVLDAEANDGPTTSELDKILFHELRDYGFNTESKLILGGSNIAGYDRAWLARFLPMFESRFVYRTLDVSPIRETLRVAGRKDLTWDEESKRRGNAVRVKHHAMNDCEDSLDEWRWYAELFHGIRPTILTTDAP